MGVKVDPQNRDVGTHPERNHIEHVRQPEYHLAVIQSTGCSGRHFWDGLKIAHLRASRA